MGESPLVNQYQRAAIVWPVLTETAARRSKITYVQLAHHFGIHPRPMRYVLGGHPRPLHGREATPADDPRRQPAPLTQATVQAIRAHDGHNEYTMNVPANRSGPRLPKNPCPPRPFRVTAAVTWLAWAS